MTNEELQAIGEHLLGTIGAELTGTTLVSEVYRLRNELMTTEDLLARATNDNEAFDLGRREGIRMVLQMFREEAAHLEVLRVVATEIELIAYRQAQHHLEQWADRLEHLQPLISPLPPESLRARVAELEAALRPFANYGAYLSSDIRAVAGSQSNPPESALSFRDVYQNTTVVRADKFATAQGHPQNPTVGDCRRADEVLQKGLS